MQDNKKLFLLDAFALIYRAYFAFIKNPRVNSKGLNTSAIFGFTNSLIELINKQDPSHIAVVFDTKKPTQRHIDYPDYKAHREPMPEGISNALPYIDRLLAAMNIQKLFVDGFEADDVIGTLAKKAEKEGFQTYMMTSDKDFAQLVSDNIFMYRPGNKWQPTSIWGVDEVLNKFKVKSVNQVVDFLGMMGDAADNIPGIPGVGEKTAQKFIAEFGSVEGLLANTHKLKGKIRDNVENSKDIAIDSKKLVTIITDVPIDFCEKNLRLVNKDEDAIRSLFEELEFRALLPRVLSLGKSIQKETSTNQKKMRFKYGNQMDLFALKENNVNAVKNSYKEYNVIKDFYNANELVKFLTKSHKIAIQLYYSTNDYMKAEVLGISLCCDKEVPSFIFLKESELITLLDALLSKEGIMLIGDNLKFQLKVLSRKNIEVRSDLFDISIAHYLLRPDMRHDIDLLSETYLNFSIRGVDNLIGKDKLKIDTGEVSLDELSLFFIDVVYVLWKLQLLFNTEMKDKRVLKLFNQIEMPLIRVLVKMEMHGITLDKKSLDRYAEILSQEIHSISEDIINYAGQTFNIASPKQLGDILFENMKLEKDAKKTKSGQFSTSEETLLRLRDKHPIIKKIIEYREIKKLLSTYILALPELINQDTNRIHTTFNQSVATTGRLSSVNPNLQNIPIRTIRGRKIRQSFISRGTAFNLLAADYSQIELRIMASLSSDEAMLKAFNDGIDIHIATAAKVYKVSISEVTKEMRFNAKSVNFGIIYGISAFGLSKNIGISRTEAKNIIEDYFTQFPKVKEYMDLSIKNARDNGYVTTILGRRRYLSDINSRNGMLRSMAERNAINAPIQGSAADIIKKAMIDVQSEIDKQGLRSKMLLQVHDELVFDMYNEEENTLKELVITKMENAVKLEVPIIVDCGTGGNWLEAH